MRAACSCFEAEVHRVRPAYKMSASLIGHGSQAPLVIRRLAGSSPAWVTLFSVSASEVVRLPQALVGRDGEPRFGARFRGAADICGFTHAFVHVGGRTCEERYLRPCRQIMRRPPVSSCRTRCRRSTWCEGSRRAFGQLPPGPVCAPSTWPGCCPRPSASKACSIGS
jgi:hypothetical protein